MKNRDDPEFRAALLALMNALDHANAKYMDAREERKRQPPDKDPRLLVENEQAWADTAAKLRELSAMLWSAL